MKYSEIRSKIKTGDVLAWTHRECKTWYDFQVTLVKMGSGSDYTHVGIAYVLGERMFVLESVGSGVRIQLLSNELPFYWIPLSDYWNQELENKAFSKFGQKYSKLDGIKSLWKKIKPGEDNQWECAEYCQWILQQGGSKMDVRNVPGEVVYWLQENGSPVHMVVKDEAVAV